MTHITSWKERIHALSTNEECITAMQDEINELREELEQARKDAGRYRWLRELPNADSLNIKYMGSDLDMIVDAAIAKEQS